MLAAAAGFALLLGTASWGKLNDMAGFEAVLTDYRLLADAMIRPAALGAAWVEAGLAATWIVAPWFPVGAMFAGVGTAALMFLYGGAIAANLLRGRTWIDCGCGGGEQLSWILVARNLVLAALAVLPLAIVNAQPPDWVDLAVSIPVVGVAFTLYLAAGTLLRNAAGTRPLQEPGR